MDVSIIIVNYNSSTLLSECINSILCSLDKISFEIIVVDNNSTDDSLDKCRTIKDKRITIIESKENLGFSKANNIGARKAIGKILHFLNPDTQIDHYLQADYDCILDDIDNGNHAVYVNPLKDREGQAYYSRNPLPGSVNWVMHYLNKKKTKWYYIGASVIMPKDIFYRVGQWNEQYFMYYEDADLFYKIYKFGFSVRCLPAIIYHYGGGSSQSTFTNLQREVLVQKGIRIYYSSNNLGKYDYWLWHILVVLSFWRKPKRMLWQIRAVFLANFY